MRPAMCAASQLPGRRPTDVDVALYLQVNQKSDNDDDTQTNIITEKTKTIYPIYIWCAGGVNRVVIICLDSRTTLSSLYILFFYFFQTNIFTQIRSRSAT